MNTPLPADALIGRLRAAGCVFAEDEARLLLDAAGSPAELRDMLDRRVGGQPLETILGWVEFCGLRVHLEAGVFVPRRRTEFLARQAVALAQPAAVVVDLCCGSGAVAAALVAAVDRAQVYAADVDPAAVRCARRNVAPERVFHGDLYDPLPAGLRGGVDVLVANAPYVPTADIAFMPVEARDHEPAVALDGGADGLDVLRRIVAGAPDWLAPGGHLLVEASPRQVRHLCESMDRSGLRARAVGDEEAGATVVIGTRSAGRADVRE